MQTAMTTARSRLAQAPRIDDERLDDLLRRGLGEAFDWVLDAPAPSRLLEVLRGRRP
ncbi:hypothetical protein [Belnapia sp. F-4-1]|uniref:hypothetical protein n=1 Tax=Belnapia sp. F-4-1 TaxID=1545443 RepID=UPI001364E25F|nr:hypothetical protein [Belnapia sp. F-4-1]